MASAPRRRFGPVPFPITFNGGATTVFANQQNDSGNWSLLGQFKFAAGTNGNVRVMDNFPEPAAVAMADGVKFVFVSGFAPPSAPSDLSASAVSTSRVDLAWADNSTNETGFVLARSASSGGPVHRHHHPAAERDQLQRSRPRARVPILLCSAGKRPSGDSTNSNEATASTLALPVLRRSPTNPRTGGVNGGSRELLCRRFAARPRCLFNGALTTAVRSRARPARHFDASRGFTNAGRYSVAGDERVWNYC